LTWYSGTVRTVESELLKPLIETFHQFNWQDDNELFYGDWHGTQVPSGTVESELLKPLIETFYQFN
jgi:hypothetical protein